MDRDISGGCTSLHPRLRTGRRSAAANDVFWLTLAAVLLVANATCFAASADVAEAIAISRSWLNSRDPAERKHVGAQLAADDGQIDAVIGGLRTATFPAVRPGYDPEEHFTVDRLRKKHADDLLYFVVPKSYRPDRPTGLIVFLHGGGSSTTRKAPRATLNFPAADSPPDTNRSGDMFAATGMITVGPSAPWHPETSYRWCVPEADEYLADVIEECKTRFNIDPDRVFLLGHSMGGFGAYHFALREPDRFAAVIANSGSWSQAYWPVVRGTPLCIVQGVHDARPGVRWHYTDIEYGRWTDKLLTADGIEHTYLEHNGQHSIGFGRAKIAQFLETAKDLRRDPYYPHVALASPVGFRSSCCYPVEHNRWLTLNEARAGDVAFDELRSQSDGSFSNWTLERRIAKNTGSAIDAINRGDNRIEVATQNVARFTVWLHPKMIDVDRPVVITVDGRTKFDGRVRPSLLTALASFERKRDWGLVYPIKIEIEVGH